jgi:protein-tyrosine-phosphatase
MKVLFICKNNQFRSQMAAAIYNKLTRTSDASSAGTRVGILDNPEAATIEQFFRTSDFFELMEENGMHIRENRTQKLVPELLDQVDTVISMAEEPFIPSFLREAKNIIWWDIENPTFATRDISEKTYKEILKLVEKLIAGK